jgi:hypothetical protein
MPGMEIPMKVEQLMSHPVRTCSASDMLGLLSIDDLAREAGAHPSGGETGGREGADRSRAS